MLTKSVKQVDLIIIMGYGGSDFCPIPFFKENLDWALEDPKGKPLEKVRKIKDLNHGRVNLAEK